MDILQAIILAIIEGLTEFIPVSSTGHMIILKEILGWDIPFAYDLVIQLGSYTAVLVYFAPRIWQIVKSYIKFSDSTLTFYRLLGFKILFSALPAGIIGYLTQDLIENTLHKATIVCIVMLTFGLVMYFFDSRNRLSKDIKALSFKNAFILGLWEILAIIPGVSRSGATIVGAMSMGFDRKNAAEISFLFGIPLILAAGFKGVFDLATSTTVSNQDILALVVGFVTAFLVGFLAVKLLIAFLSTHSLKPFIIYRLTAGIISLSYILV